MDRLNKIENNEKIFGEQIILNDLDEQIRKVKDLLVTSTTISIYEAIKLCNYYGGVGIPAHIDRHANSIITNLGFIPEDLDISLVEFSKNANPEEFLASMINPSNKEYKYIVSSDSHYLEQMVGGSHYFELEENADSHDIINFLKKYK